jgi:hypothetical protein
MVISFLFSFFRWENIQKSDFFLEFVAESSAIQKTPTNERRDPINSGPGLNIGTSKLDADSANSTQDEEQFRPPCVPRGTGCGWVRAGRHDLP